MPLPRVPVPGTSMAVPHLPPDTARAPAARGVAATAPPVALTTPTTGSSSTTPAPATTTARRIRSRIANPQAWPRHTLLAARMTRGSGGAATNTWPVQDANKHRLAVLQAPYARPRPSPGEPAP